MMTTCGHERVKTAIITEPSAEQSRMIMNLYQRQGWWQAADDENPDLIPRLIAGSHCFVVALEGNHIVGMGRAISDGVSDAYIQDLTVSLEYRRRGIGRIILKTIMEKLHDDEIRWIGLIAEPGSFDLYEKAGFRQMADRIPMLFDPNI